MLRIEDNKGMAGTSNLRLIIGDRNDNPMKPGASSIFVYNYEGSAPDTEIGRLVTVLCTHALTCFLVNLFLSILF